MILFSLVRWRETCAPLPLEPSAADGHDVGLLPQHGTAEARQTGAHATAVDCCHRVHPVNPVRNKPGRRRMRLGACALYSGLVSRGAASVGEHPGGTTGE